MNNDFHIGDLVKVRSGHVVREALRHPLPPHSLNSSFQLLGMVISIDESEGIATIRFPAIQRTDDLYVPWNDIEIIKKAMI